MRGVRTATNCSRLGNVGSASHDPVKTGKAQNQANVVRFPPKAVPPDRYKIVFMQPKYSVTTIASYDEAILKQLKGPMTDTRPTSSVVRTISE
jgi:hypothetical protein